MGDRMTGHRGRHRKLLARLLRAIFIVGGVGFLVHGLWSTWDVQGRIAPAWASIAAAFSLLLLRLYFAPRSWVVLFEKPTASRELIRGYYLSLLGRYIPGGIWQAVGQVTVAADLGISRVHATTLLVVHAVIQAIAGAVVGAALGVFGTHLPLWARLASLTGLCSLFFLHRAWMVWTVLRLAALLKRGNSSDSLLPSQTAIFRAFGWAVATILSAGIAFGVLAGSLVPGVSMSVAVPAFALAWTVGFICVPIPAGAGVREAALLFALASTQPALIVASVDHRLIAMLTELVVLGGLLAVRRSRNPQSRRSGPPVPGPSSSAST